MRPAETTGGLACLACDSTIDQGSRFPAREMMYGTREEFEYVECADCGSVQIAEVPDAEVLARHYPPDYYSFSKTGPGRLRAALLEKRDRYLLGRRSLGGRLLAERRPDPILRTLVAGGLGPTDRVLDVGCGSGTLLDRLARAGLPVTVGVDPFLGADSTTPGGATLVRRYLTDMDGEFDVVMFNHALEHVAAPLADLTAAAARLAPGGRILVRLPTTSSEAWETYRADWIQLDPPRHLVVPSRAGMETLAARAGLRLERTVDDSSAFQFVGSELYRRDIPMSSPEITEAFTAEEVADFEDRARELNRQGRGDQAMFVLTK